MTSERFARLKLLLGEEGLETLAESTVMVVGLGGVGSSCAEALARGGVGNLILIDGDVVEPSNLNRQALAFVSTIGRVKAEVMEAMVADINPDCTTYARQIFLSHAKTWRRPSSSSRVRITSSTLSTMSPARLRSRSGARKIVSTSFPLWAAEISSTQLG